MTNTIALHCLAGVFFRSPVSENTLSSTDPIPTISKVFACCMLRVQRTQDPGCGIRRRCRSGQRRKHNPIRRMMITAGALGVRRQERQTRSELRGVEISRRIEALGAVAAEPLRALRREVSAALKHEPGETVLEIALQLLKQQTFSHRFIAYEVVHYHRGALRALASARSRNWGAGLRRGPTSTHSRVTSPDQYGREDRLKTTSSQRGRDRRIDGSAERPW